VSNSLEGGRWFLYVLTYPKWFSKLVYPSIYWTLVDVEC
jgi:hypothetical protein